MSETRQKILIEGMHCNACEKTIKKAVLGISGVERINVNFRNKIAEVSFNSENQPIQKVLDSIKSRGYSAIIYSGSAESISSEKIDEENSFVEKFSHFGVGIFTDFEKFHVERKLLIFSALSLLIVFGLQYAAYFGFFKNTGQLDRLFWL